MEADLARTYQVDLRDLYRPGRQLTLRRLWVLVRHLPTDSSVALVVGPRAAQWQLEHHLLDEIRIGLAALAGEKKPKPAPGRFGPSRLPHGPDWERRLAAAKRRARDRRQAIEAGVLTRRRAGP